MKKAYAHHDATADDQEIEDGFEPTYTQVILRNVLVSVYTF